MEPNQIPSETKNSNEAIPIYDDEPADQSQFSSDISFGEEFSKGKNTFAYTDPSGFARDISIDLYKEDLCDKQKIDFDTFISTESSSPPYQPNIPLSKSKTDGNVQSSSFFYFSNMSENSDISQIKSIIASNQEVDDTGHNSMLTNEDEQNLISSDIYNFTKQMHFYNSQTSAIKKNVSKLQNTLESLIENQIKAISNNQFTTAKQLNTEISEAQEKIFISTVDMSSSIAQALDLVADVPKLYEKKSHDLVRNIPQLLAKKSSIIKQISNLENQQKNDKELLTSKQKSIEEEVTNLRAPLEQLRKEHYTKCSQISSEIDQCQRPFNEKIAKLQSEKNSHMQSIISLQNEIEQHRMMIKNITNQINIEEKNKDIELQKFSDAQKQLQQSEEMFLAETQKIENQIRTIEMPLTCLQNTIIKNDEEIQTLNITMNEIIKNIHEAEYDSQHSTKIITKLRKINTKCNDYLHDKTKIILNYEKEEKKYLELNSLKLNRSVEIAEIKNNKNKISDFIETTEKQIPELEITKKNAVKAKNFKSAQQISKQIKVLQEKLNQSQNELNQLETKMNEMEKNLNELNNEVNDTKINAENHKNVLTKFDKEFFGYILLKMDRIFEISPFCRKSLMEFHQLAEGACEIGNDVENVL